MSHPIISTLSQRFREEIRGRGRAYYERGAVRIAEADASRVLATVEGTRRYSVELEFRGEKVDLSCSCPYFLDFDTPCKHLWAVILALDDHSYFERRSEREAGKRGGSLHDIERVLSSIGRRERPFPRAGVPPGPRWRRALEEIRAVSPPALRPPPATGGRRELYYVLDPRGGYDRGEVLVRLFDRPTGSSRDPLPIPPGGFRTDDLAGQVAEEELELIALLREASRWRSAQFDQWRGSPPRRSPAALRPHFLLEGDLAALLLPKMCRTGRARLLRETEGTPLLSALALDDEGDWHLALAIEEATEGWRLRGLFERGEETLGLEETDLLAEGGLFLARGLLSRYAEEGTTRSWLAALGGETELTAGEGALEELLAALLAIPDLPPLAIDGAAAIRVECPQPRSRLRVRSCEEAGYSIASGRLFGDLSFDYDGRVANADSPPSGIYLEDERVVVLRSTAAEREARERLLALGFREVRDSRAPARVLKIAGRRLPEIVRGLLAEGWVVEAERKLYRQADRIEVRFSSGVDWFEATGAAVFGDQTVGLPELLTAVRRHRSMVRLGDGSFGVLPEEWLAHEGLALTLGEARDGAVRYGRPQALLVDALLRERRLVSWDAEMGELRRHLEQFDGIEACEAPSGFAGSLRGYQKEGLGWFRFLDRFGFGGCLADDMGLGKTVQVLALLEAVREEASSGSQPPEARPSLLDGTPLGGGSAARRPTSLVVVPKSLLFNWKAEAARFAPQLAVLEHVGSGRRSGTEGFGRYDVVLTTYGTLRNDVARLAEFSFDYIVLDEAQMIKNAQSVTAKATRLLSGRRRLALSGTPVENHLGELWSLFEFLNPGMLGGVSLFSRHFAAKGTVDPEKAQPLARALRPFILRRTKQQVAPELPQKVEQTLYCELSRAERRRYDELLGYYRRELERRIAASGFGRTKIHVLEALLRLRQAACDPALLDPTKASRPGTKVELLLEQLGDVLAEGRKALVFSQFTTFLAVVAKHLEREGMSYEYLDGKTRDREARISRFQEDPDCPIFLVSLKAGGLGLNLTAAEYVFILDPWWNPAVEAQAVDRTHRIGQERTVFAYRLIAKDTVEEKVLALQSSKRAIAEAIITEDNRMIGRLTREDLELLLS